MLLNLLKKLFSKKSRYESEMDVFTKESYNLKDEINSNSIENFYVPDQEVEKMVKLMELGLVNSESVIQTQEEINKSQKIKNFYDTIQYYENNYPLFNYIPFSNLKEICIKYGFVCCTASYYNKDIPGSAISDINLFKLKDEDLFYHGILPNSDNKKNIPVGISIPHHPFNVGFEVVNKEIYETFNNIKKPSVYNKKKYFDSFPIIICTQPHNLSVESKEVYKQKHAYTAILKPVYRNGIYGVIILSVFNDAPLSKKDRMPSDDTNDKMFDWIIKSI